ITLNNVTVTDNLVGLVWVTGPNVGTLTPGQSATATATYVVTEADIIAGGVDNVATGTGEIPPGCVNCPDIDPPTSPEIHIPTEDPKPAFKVEKEADTAGPAHLGDTITYTFTVTNTGNVTLTDATVVDTMAGLVWVTGPNVGTLIPGQSATASATYVVTEADVIAGGIDNVATATVVIPPDCISCPPIDPGEPPEIHIPTEGPNPMLKLEKSADNNGPATLGQTVTYTFLVTNTGNVTINDVTITDPMAGLTWVTGPLLGTLAPGASASGTATYVVTQADIDAGAIENVATANATCVGVNCVVPPDPSEKIVPTDDPSGIHLEKDADTEGPVKEGDVITYTFTVTNTGKVTLTNITVDDPMIGSVFCANTLAPGASVSCSATYTVTAADVEAGSIYNLATAEGTDPDGGTVTDDDDDEVPTENPCTAPMETPLSGDVLALSIRALQEVDPSTPVVEPTEVVTEEPTEVPTETGTATAEPTETVTVEPTETATGEITETATATATVETSADDATPNATVSASCPSPTPVTPQPTPTPRPSNPGNPGGGGNIPPVTTLPGTGDGAAVSNGWSKELFLPGMMLFGILIVGFMALRRSPRRTRLDQ
ncbi:MAG: DUF7507 domain-containing protein, partial [Thermomicrobiales bacterium]